MAPEYLVKGQVTEKADVYSYGVLVLEIVCGRKNISLAEDDSGSLIQTVSSKLVSRIHIIQKNIWVIHSHHELFLLTRIYLHEKICFTRMKDYSSIDTSNVVHLF